MNECEVSPWSQAGTPAVHVTSRYDAAAHTLTMTCTQTVPPTPGKVRPTSTWSIRSIQPPVNPV